MYIYVGKLNWFEYAKDECITVVFPGGFALNDPVCAYWQWTVDKDGNKKSNTAQKGMISSVANTAGKYRVFVPFDYYKFDAVVNNDFQSLSLTMLDPAGETSTTLLQLVQKDPVRVPSTSVYTGKINWFEYAQNEMATLVFPGEFANSQPVCLSHQWTRDTSGNEKTNHTVEGKLRAVNATSNGDINGQFDDGFYTYGVKIKKNDARILLSMTNPSSEADSSAPYDLKQTDHRDIGVKKAFIIRFDTGTDNGIFQVKDMLTKHLGFAESDIEVSWFDVDPPKGPKKCTKGQAPPTAANFKTKFTQLLTGARPGDVRFVYVDAHGTSQQDPDGSGEADDQDEGWKFAGNTDGTQAEIVYDDWVGKALRDHLASGVNMTILTSSCMGGGMLDTHRGTPGILLAGCHETQFNVKALNGRDPWMVAVVTVIKNQVGRKRGVPTYQVLYNEAKQFIRAQMRAEQLKSTQYLGPSPDETRPIPKDMSSKPISSHQDPQLIFHSGYIDAGEEVFLSPFKAPTGSAQVASGQPTRFPKDEYPHEEL